MRKETRSGWAFLLAVTCAAWLTGVPRARADEPVISLLTDEKPGPAASHGAEKLMGALRGQFLIVAGRAEGDGPAARMLKAGKHPAPEGPEALVLPAHRVERQTGLADRRLGRPRGDVRRCTVRGCCAGCLYQLRPPLPRTGYKQSFYHRRLRRNLVGMGEKCHNFAPESSAGV